MVSSAGALLGSRGHGTVRLIIEHGSIGDCITIVQEYCYICISG